MAERVKRSGSEARNYPRRRKGVPDTEVLLRVVYKELKPRRVKVASVMERYDPYTPEGKAMLSVQATFSTFYIDNLSTEVSKGYREKFERGGWIGLLPLGYESVFDRDTKGTPIKGTSQAIFSTDAANVRRIFESYATGNYSDLSLAEELNSEGHTAVWKGRRVPFSKDTIGGILTNRFYLGYVTYLGEEKKGAHGPLIDEGLWDRVQAIRAARTRTRGGGRVSYHPGLGLLLEFAFCGHCGARLHWSRGNREQGRYWCSRRREFGKEACNAPLIAGPPIDALLLDVLRGLSLPPSYRSAVIQVVKDRLARPSTPEAAAATPLHEQLARIKDLYVLGDIARTEYLRKREQLQHQIALSTPSPIRVLDVERAMELLGNLPALLDTATPAQQRALIRQVIPRVWIENLAITAIEPTASYAILMGVQVSMATSAGLQSI
jgi:site-specific DNA recombinase